MSKSNRAEESKSWSPSEFVVEAVDDKTRFHDLDLQDSLLRGVAELGFQYCSPIQAKILPHTLQGHDAIGKAQTGTGKTAAFLITIFNDLLCNPPEGERYLAEPRAVIIAPTRELVMQIAADAEDLGKFTGLQTVTMIGGADYQKQLAKVQSRVVDLVVATPGRLIDFMQRRDLFLDRVETLVLDEADRMLDMGFIPQVKRIVRATPRKEDRQTLLFSATFTQDILNLAQQWTFDPVTVEIEPERVATATVDQRVYLVTSHERLKVLLKVLRGPDAVSTIVFANRRDQVRSLHEKLRKAGISCGILSGEITQARRTKTLADFKSGKIAVLVATDVAGRGIHVDGVSHVVNYNLPEDPEDYVHRIGRTGRAGATGISISFASEDDAFLLPDIETLLGERLKCVSPPADLLD
ncbi:ATP-dependent RNA helicase [marine gamma proteobacterium HTCC2080]|nr:ATP-dependent RNA helicase [marine gamma proteobacterium HTCC2080]MBT4854737.1 ATP-dependent RNA helicase RhlB [Halieaceae bacterium]MDG1493592.1 ATP-dependent RNA helicase RhlB [Luminiphilus sp.]MBT5209992.1 ATP-dependent RNA helicase RhlB [Halieaceae bacterium]MBT6263185.1 ATP-dependent RNA helicase RhlB [Halieaceae bacterium]